MNALLETLSIYMEPVGVEAFGESLLKSAAGLEQLRNQLSRRSVRTVVTESGVTAPGSLGAGTLPDALWLLASKRTPKIGFYPMGEVAERAFKRTIVWLALFAGRKQPLSLGTDLKTLAKQLGDAVQGQKRDAILCYFLTEYFFEVCMDSNRRWKTHTAADPCYRYHFPDGATVRSLASESKVRDFLHDTCRKLAEECMPALLKSLEESTPASITDELSRVYRKAMGRQPGRVEPQTSSAPPLNILLGSTPDTQLQSDFALDPDMKRFHLEGDHENVRFHYADVEKILAETSGGKTSQLHSLSRDLLDIGVVVYMADQVVKRAQTLQRRLDILMPVRHLREWKAEEPLLAETISFLGRDEVHFHFVASEEAAHPIRFKLTGGPRRVCLLSGGLDSAAGAVQVLKKGLKPVLVSHHSSAFTSHLQTDLVQELKKITDQPLPWLNLYVAKSLKDRTSDYLEDYPKTQMTQFLRSFLFLSVASVVAIESHIETVLLFENGPIALNPMFSEAKLNTRTAHPRFIAGFQTLVERLFQVKLKIENPFLKETKAEVAGRFAKPELEPIVRKTNSCWGSYAVPARAKGRKRTGFVYRHDGDCLSCIVRRVALSLAGLAHVDVPYLVDVFTEFPGLPITRQVLIADYLRFCTNLGRLDDAELLLKHPDFSVFAPGVDPRELIIMYRRHCAEMVESFRSLGSDETERSVLPTLQ